MELPEDIQLIVQEIGEQNTQKLLRIFGGSSVYFPNTIETTRIHDEIIRRYNSEKLSYKELGREYGYSENWIRTIHRNWLKNQSKKADKEHPTLFSM